MKKLELKLNDLDPSDDADQICNLFESRSGLKFRNQSSTNPNEVHGYIDTELDLSTEDQRDVIVNVYFYEQEDVDALQNKSTAILAACPLTNEEIMQKIEEAKVDYPNIEVISGL